MCYLPIQSSNIRVLTLSFTATNCPWFLMHFFECWINKPAVEAVTEECFCVFIFSMRQRSPCRLSSLHSLGLPVMMGNAFKISIFTIKRGAGLFLLFFFLKNLDTACTNKEARTAMKYLIRAIGKSNFLRSMSMYFQIYPANPLIKLSFKSQVIKGSNLGFWILFHISGGKPGLCLLINLHST